MNDSPNSSPVRVSPDRWRPERAGLINVWQYTNEILRFEKGRMVLYGPNGSGKTMALELLLPYLLDAKGQQSRLTTSGIDRGGFWSRITGYDAHGPKTGYLWLEFRRASGGEVFTCGVRLRAKDSRSGDRHWFTTSARIGQDLALLDKQGHPLGPEKLREAIGSRGRVWGSDASGYRSRVRAVLFPGRSEDQVESMVRTLLTVRKQSVSDGLSPRVLSNLLSQALPPLDDLELGKVADGFADLDRRRDHIAGLEQDLHTIEQLVRSNRAYARAVSAKVVHSLVSATTDFERVAKNLKQAQTSLEELKEKVDEIEDLLAHLEESQQTLAGEQSGLEQSEHYREGQRLASLKTDLNQQLQAVQQAQSELETEQASLKRCQDSLERAKAHQAKMQREFDRTREQLQDRVQRLSGPDTSESEADKVRSLIQAWIEGRQDAIRALRKCLVQLERALDRRNDALNAKIKASEKLDEAEEARTKALEAKDAAQAQWWQQEATWREQAPQLSPNYLTGEDPWLSQESLALAYASSREPLIEARTRLAETRSLLDAQLKEVRAELKTRKSGQELAPQAPPDRRDRSALDGAPLWKLLEFRPGLSEQSKQGIESALHHAQVLDAWVSASGKVELEAGLADVVALRGSKPAQSGHTPTPPLMQDPSAKLDHPQALDKFLASIVWVDKDADKTDALGLVIGHDGSWRSSHLFGRAPLQPARYIGAASREAARLARIAELERQETQLIEELEACRQKSAALQDQLAQCDEEKQRFPSTKTLDEKMQELNLHEDRVQQRKASLLEAVERLDQTEEEVADRQEALEHAALESSLPASSEQLDTYEKDIDRITSTLHDYTRHMDNVAQARRNVDQESSREQEAEKRKERSAQRHRASTLKHKEMNAKVEALEAAVGQSYQQLVARLAAIHKENEELKQRQKELIATQKRLAHEQGGLEATCKQATQERESAMQARAQTHEQYLDLIREGLPNDAGLELDFTLAQLDTYTARLASARELRRQKNMDEPPKETRLNQLLTGVHKWQHQATQQLAGKVSLSFEPQARDWSVLRARQDGILKSGVELRAQLSEEQTRARDEIDQKQQALFEEILTGSLREHLKERLWSADALIERINRILGTVRSAAGGVRVVIGWEIDSELPESQSLARAKELLIHDSPLNDGRVELDQFLRNRVEQIRADESDSGDWRERLERMLDYRDWHRFVVRVHHNRFGDQPRGLASRNVSLSAGEKTIVMVLPLIAAVVAHYEPASTEPPCESPRLLLMDEIFPKVDFANKAQLMGLLPKLHLDGVFTSDKDRCEYKTLDGISIHVFEKFGDDKTTTTRLVWNGRDLQVAPDEQYEMAGVAR